MVSQIFVLFYNFTGNTLYDYTIFMYSFMAMSGLAVIRGECAGETVPEEEPHETAHGELLAGAPIMEIEG